MRDSQARQALMQAKMSQLGGTSRQVEVPPPFGGLNTRDSRSGMAPQDAIQMKNVISEPGGVKSRLGYDTFGTGITGTVEFIADYSSGATRKMLVGAGSVVYDLTTSGGTANSLKTGCTNARWESAQLSGTMVIVNGDDTPELYNGTTLTTGVYSGDIATPGADTMDGISTHKSRMYMWDTGSSDFYYGATNAVQGAFTQFQLGQVSATGGNLLMVETISRDGGSGPDDYAAFILDTGEVIIYQGNDPGTAANWALVGRYFIPAPINKRCSAKFGGDVMILTRQDIISLAEVIKTGTEGEGINIQPSKLSGSIEADFATYGTNYGWQLIVYGKRAWSLINVPETTDTTYSQYIHVMTMNAPAKFTGWNGSVFGVFNNGLYFGGDGVVYQADNGFDDGGANIDCVVQQAYSIFSIPNVKNVKNVTITYQFDNTATLGAEVAYDYVDKVVINQATAEAIGVAWDDADWDTSEWAGVSSVRNVKFSTSGAGRAVSIIIDYSIKGAQFTWLGSNLNLDVQAMI